MINGHYWAREKGWSINYSYNSLDLCSIESYDSVNLMFVELNEPQKLNGLLMLLISEFLIK